MRFRLVQPRNLFPGLPVPPGERIDLPFPVFHLVHRWAQHAGPSGYDRLTDYIGEPLRVGPVRHFLGETIFRMPALWTDWRGPNRLYSRYDWVLEGELLARMKVHRRALFHVLYGERSFVRSRRPANRPGNRLVVTLHHPPEDFLPLFRSTRHLARIDHAVLMSSNQVELVESLIGPGRTTVVPHGVDLDYFRPGSGEDRECDPICLFAGNFQRDFDLLPEVIRGVLGRLSRVRFILLSPRPECAAIARDQSRVEWIPRLDDEAYAALLRRASMLVMPQKCSTANNAALEAMASGLPVVTNEGGIADYVLPDGGILCPLGDAEAMVEAVCGLMSEPGRLQEAQRRGRCQAERFSMAAMAQKTAEVYLRVMQD